MKAADGPLLAGSAELAEASEKAAFLLEELCAISSASGDVAGLQRMADRVASELRRFGFTSEIMEMSGLDDLMQPVLVARGPGPTERPMIAVGHLDTVLPAIPPRRCGDRVTATGALDMKGGFAAFIGGLALLEAVGRPIPQNLTLLAVPDEEVGGPISESVIREWGRHARCVLVLEPGEPRGDAETLVTGRRGLSTWRLRAVGRPAHAGLAYWEGRSAVAAAATWCGRVQALSERQRGPVVNVGRIVGGDAEFVDGLAVHHSLAGTNHRLNVVSECCMAEGEVRFLSPGDRERMLACMREVAHEIELATEVRLTLEIFERIEPVDPSGPGRELASVLVERAAAQGWNLELEDDRGGISFPNFLPDASRMAVLDGLGPVGGGMHTRNEYLCLRSLERRIGLFGELFSMF